MAEQQWHFTVIKRDAGSCDIGWLPVEAGKCTVNIRLVDNDMVRAPGRELKRGVEGMRAELTVNPQGLCNQVGF